MPLDWQTRVAVTLFKRGDQNMFSNFRGFPLLTHPSKVYDIVLERKIHLLVKAHIQEETWWFAILDQLFTLSERMEVCPMSLHVFCELGQGIRLHLLEHHLVGVRGVQVDWPVAAVHSVPVQW